MKQNQFRTLLYVAAVIAVGMVIIFGIQSGKKEADDTSIVEAKRKSPTVGVDGNSLKRKRTGGSGINRVQETPKERVKLANKEVVEDKPVINKAVDPLSRGATRDAAGNYVAKTRDAYQPSKKIPRHPMGSYVPVTYKGNDLIGYRGAPVVALVDLPGRGAGDDKGRFELKPNENGEFPRIYVKPEEEVEVRLLYPKTKEGAKYAIGIQDGGLLDDGTPSGLIELEKSKEIAFRFEPSANNGTHRIVIRSDAGNINVLDFWVGQELVYAEPSADTSSRDAAIAKMQARRAAIDAAEAQN